MKTVAILLMLLRAHNYQINFHNQDTITTDFKEINVDGLRMNLVITKDSIIARRMANPYAHMYKVKPNGCFYADQECTKEIESLNIPYHR